MVETAGQSQRRHNTADLMRALRQHGPQSRADLSRCLGLSKVTVSAVAAQALEQELIAEGPVATGGVGRRPTLLDLASTLGLVAAVDIHARTLTLRLADLRGQLLHEANAATPESPVGFAQWLVGLLRTACQEQVSQLGDLRSLVVSVPASVDGDSALRCVGEPSYLADMALAAELRSQLPDTVVRLINNSNAAALAEHATGCATDWPDFVFVGIGQSGVGAGLILGGRAYDGGRGCAGEIGGLHLGDDEKALDALARADRSAAFYARLAQLISLMAHLLDLDGVVLHAAGVAGRDWAARLPAALARHSDRRVTLRAAALGEAAALTGSLQQARTMAWNDIEHRIATGG